MTPVTNPSSGPTDGGNLGAEPQPALKLPDVRGHRVLWTTLKSVVRRPSFSRADALTVAVALLLASAARSLLDPTLDDRAPHVTYMVAVVFVAWQRGFWPTLLTVLLGAMLANYLFVAPRYSFIDAGVDNQIVGVLNLLLGIFVALVSESLRAIGRENERLYRVAAAANIRKEEFLAMASHELRNPLMPIQNGLYLMSQHAHQDPQTTELRLLIERQVTHLMRLVDDLLDVSRVTQGKITLRRQSIDLRQPLEDAMSVARPLIESQQQQLAVALPQHPLPVLGDAVRLTQVFANLLNNAAKYTPRGGRIWLTAESHDGQAVVRVHDTGVGLNPTDRARIFGLFEQVRVGLEGGGGLGVGLAIVRTLVDMHGGTVSVDSPGANLGSEFVVRLPVVQSSASPETPKQPTSPIARHACPPGRILIVDDNVASADSLAAVLKLDHHDVRTAYDGFAALEIAATFRPEIVLIDLGLPQMDGLQLGRELMRLESLEGTRLIAVTGYPQPADLVAAAGFEQQFVKPLQPVEVQQLVDDLLSSRAFSK